MPKTKVRKSRVRKSRMRKSLRTKRGGTRSIPNETKSKAEKSENFKYDPKRYQRSMSLSKYSPSPSDNEFVSDDDDKKQKVITRKKPIQRSMTRSSHSPPPSHSDSDSE
jgi:hypothetical protein